jgi:ElaB/YqjD/DUF883 family membrane-anchored ribosome-binding protein
MLMEKKSTGSQYGKTVLDIYSLADQIGSIRTDLQNLNAAVSRVVKHTATETTDQLEQTFQQNLFYTIAIALGLGFLFGVLLRR